MSRQTAKIKTSLLLECIEISGDILVWKDFRPKLNLKRSKRYMTGKQVQATYGGGKKGEFGRPYIRINMFSISYQISYVKVILWVKTGKEPDTNCWLIDGNPLNLNVSNATSEFASWWDRAGVENPCKKGPR